MIAAAIDPSAEGDFGSDLFDTQFVASVGA